MTETKTITEEIKEVKEMLSQFTEEAKPKEKKFRKPRDFKIPFNARVNKPKAKKNYVTVLHVKENGDMHFTKEQITDQTLMIDGVPRIATADVVGQHKGKPMMILPSWSVKPFSRVDHYEDSERQLLNIKGYKVLMDRMKKEAISAKKSISWWWIIIGLIVLGVVAYFFITGQKAPVPKV